MTAGQSEANREFGEYDTDPDERGTEHPLQGRNGMPKGGASERIKELAKHKEPKVAWHTCVGPHVMWGTQEPMWPVSPRAMTGNATPRVKTLAAPKKNFQTGTVHEGRPIYHYSIGRPSMIWTVSEEAKNGSASERVQVLAKHKEHHPDYSENKDQFFYSCGRQSPIWEVQSGAAQAPDRPRTMLLAQHKDYHPDYQGERPIQTEVRETALVATASDRVASLAVPKIRSDGPFRDPQWPVSEKAKSSVASSRCLELARSKPLAEGFQHARGVEWPVSKAARQAQATPRVEELSRPITRDTMDTVQFNPAAFTVKQSALKGVIPPRIQELAQPFNR